MKSKKTLAILLAIMMILSSIPMFASAATKPTVTTLPTITNAEVGKTYFDLILEGGEASVPGTFSITINNRLTSPNDAKIRVLFTPTDTENYSTALSIVTVEVQPCSAPVLEGSLVSQEIKLGASLGSLTPALAEDARILAYDFAITRYVESITWDNPDKIYTEAGTYEEPVTIKFATYSLTNRAYAVDLKATATVNVIDGRLSTEITTAPTLADSTMPESKKAGDLVLNGGAGSVEGAFSVTNPEQELSVGMNTINVTFTPEDTENYKTSSTDISVLIKGNIEATVSPDYVYTYEYGTKYLNHISGNASSFGITTNLPEDITVNASASKAVDANGNEVDVQDRYLAPGNYTVTTYVFAEAINVEGIGNVQLYNPTYVEIPVVITKKVSTTPFGVLDITGTTNGEGQSSAGIYYKYNNVEGVNGHCVLKVNGETVVDNIPVTATTYSFVTNTSGKYTATLEYIPAENDYVEFETTVLTQEFELEVLEKEEDLGGLLPGVDSGLDIELPEIDLELPELELDTDGDHKFNFVNIIQNLIEMLKNFIKQIGQTIEGIL